MDLKAYFKKRKLWKQYKDLRTTVNYTLKSDDDILPENAKAELAALSSEIAEVKKFSSDLAMEESRLEKWETRLSAIVPRSSFVLCTA